MLKKSLLLTVGLCVAIIAVSGCSEPTPRGPLTPKEQAEADAREKEAQDYIIQMQVKDMYKPQPQVDYNAGQK